MTPHVIGSNDERRLAAVRKLALLDTMPEREYDSIVALTAQLLDMPHAFITLLDRERLWLKAKQGVEVDEIPRSVAFCERTMAADAQVVVDDLTRDPDFHDSPLVTGDAALRFYAGVPLHVPDADGRALPIGTLCVLDNRPRTLSDAGKAAMQHLADLAEALLAARSAAQRATEMAALAERQAADLAHKDIIFRQAERMAQIGSWRFVPLDEAVEWSEGVFRIHGLAADQQPPLDRAMEFYPPHARATISEALATAVEQGAAFDVETDFLTADGSPRRVRTLGEPELVDGAVVSLVGVFQDVTDRYALEQQLRRSAELDELTGIANRAAFNRRLDGALERAHADGSELMLALIDLDGFKEVNDTLGHLAGDDVLRAVARRLEEPWLARCFAARLGGDEFALIVTDPGLLADRDSFVERLEAALRVPVTAGKLTIAASGTVGTALLGRHDNGRDFVHAADTDLYAAKRRRIGDRRRAERRRAAA